MVIVREINRPDSELVASLGEHTAADIHEAMGKRNAMAPAIGPIGGETTVCGPACTAVVHPGDNMMAHVAVEYAQPGDVLVVAAASDRAAIWGELSSRNAMAQDIAGLVTGGNVRDSAWLESSSFPVFAPAVSQAGAVKETPGSVNVPVSVGDVVVSPGDIVVGDADGITVVPSGRAEDVLAAADAHAEREQRFRERINDGETLYNLLGLEKTLAASDTRVVDTAGDR